MNLRREKKYLNAELWYESLIPMNNFPENMDLCIGRAVFKTRIYIVDFITNDIISGKT